MNVIVGLLPLLSFALTMLAFMRAACGIRLAFLNSALVWGLLVLIDTEGLSLFHSFDRNCVIGFWLVAILFQVPLVAVRGLPWQNVLPRAKLRRLPPSWIAIIILLVTFMLSVGVVALLRVPDTWDSFTYHLARIMHWIQNQDVTIYPTNILRQVTTSPWAEYANAQLIILKGDDAWANLIQYFAFTGCAIAASLIVAQLRGGLRSQIFAAVFAVTLPMAVLQGSSTQNDLIAAFWLMCLAYYGLRLTVSTAPTFLDSLAVGCSLGLAWLTKGTVYCATALCLALFLALLCRRRGIKGLRSALTVLSVALLINGAYYARNISVFHMPLDAYHMGIYGGDKVRIESYTPQAFASNIVRNISAQLDTHDRLRNDLVVEGVANIHHLIGINQNDPHTTHAFCKYDLPVHEIHGDLEANPLHVGIIFLAVLLFLYLPQFHKANAFSAYMCFAVVASLSLCAALKWQPWISRLELPILVIWAPAVAMVCGTKPLKRTAGLISIVLIAAAIPALLFNSTFPLEQLPQISQAPRLHQYFAECQTKYDKFIYVGKFIRDHHLKRVALVADSNDGEYLLWVTLKSLGVEDFKVDNMCVHNATAGCASEAAPQPEFVVVLSGPDQWYPPELKPKYAWLYATKDISIMRRSELAAGPTAETASTALGAEPTNDRAIRHPQINVQSPR